MSRHLEVGAGEPLDVASVSMPLNGFAFFGDRTSHLALREVQVADENVVARAVHSIAIAEFER